MFIEPLEARIAPALIYGLRNDQHLIAFDSAHPGTLLADVPISEALIGALDFIAVRPSTGQLYAVGYASGGTYLYTLNPATGALTEVGSSPFTTSVDFTAGGGMSFDPVSNVIRVAALDARQFRVNPDTGALIAEDTALHETGHPAPQPYALAYDRNFAGATATTLYTVDYQTDTLLRIGDPNGSPNAADGGVATPIGPFFTNNTSTSTYDGMTIDPRTGAAFAAITSASGVNFYSVDLATGKASALGKVGDGSKDMLSVVAAPGDVKILSDQLATYTDLDGDLVTVKTTGHGLTATGFHFLSGPLGSQLTELDLSGLGLEGKSLTITATPALHGGDGWVNVGTINAPGLALGGVTVGGDLGAINAGDGENSLGSLTVHSLGKLGHSTQAAGTGSLVSTLGGHLGALVVKSDLAGAQVQVTGGAAGSIGSVSIGGDLLAASDGVTAAGVSSTGAMGNVFVGGSIVGGNASGDGSIISHGALGNVTIGGSILGGTKTLTGWVKSFGNMGAVKIGHDVVGGAGADGLSGGVYTLGNLASATVGGSLLGGAGDVAGSIHGLGNEIGPVKIGGSLVGGAGGLSGAVDFNGSLGSVTVGGSLIGGGGLSSGLISGATAMGQITIRGDVGGGPNSYSGSIALLGEGHLAGVTIGGSLIGSSTPSGILANAGGTIGPIVIGGEIRADMPGDVSIVADGVYGSKTPAIASVTVKGSVHDALILAGVLEPNPDASIGAVSVGGNWIASSLGAGTTGVGLDSDVKASEPTPDAILSSIKSVTIAGYVAGNFGVGGSFGLEAEQIGKVQVGARVYTLAPGTDKIGFALGTTGDVRLREVDTTGTTIPAPPASTPNQLAFTNTATAHTATFLDQDGDLVTIAITGAPAGAVLGAGNLSLTDGPYGSRLAGLDLSNAAYGQAWKGASVSITAEPQGGHGDSFVNVGYLNATGVDLGNVTIHGDLGQIDAGDNQIGPSSLGLKSLTVQSLGYFGTGGQIAQGASTESDIRGSMTSLTIKTDLARATVQLTGSSELATAAIGGDIIGDTTNPESLSVAGGLSVENDIASLTIGGSVLGGAAAHSGEASTSFGAMARLVIGGSIFGGAASYSGGIDAHGLGPVAIGGDVIGGTSDHTGFVHAAGNIASVTLGGSIIGHSGATVDSGIIYANLGGTNNIGAVKIGGSLIGSDTVFSGSLNTVGAIASVKIAGSLVGAAGVASGDIVAGTLGSVAIGGDARAAAGAVSGSIEANGSVGSVTIAGSLVGSASDSVGVLSISGHLGAVAIGGSVRGADAGHPVLIYATGDAGQPTGIASLTVHGSVSEALITAGAGLEAPLNADAGIGAVSIGGDLQASSLIAGVRNLNGFTHTGDGNDSAQDTTPDAIFSKIASVTVGGMALGTPGVAGDHFGIVAQIVGKVKVGAATYLLSPGDYLEGLAVGPSGDLTVREV